MPIEVIATDSLSQSDSRSQSVGGGIFNEASRVLDICNACRYCEGVCAMFKEVPNVTTFNANNLDYLANLCHNCGACFQHCQYAPPHDFAVNIPAALTAVRIDSYQRYAWPAFMGRLFEHNPLISSVTTVVALVGLAVLLLTTQSTERILEARTGPGSFYEVISHLTMVVLAGSTFTFSVLAIWMSTRRYIESLPRSPDRNAVKSSLRNRLRGVKSALTLENLGGGHDEGCGSVPGERSNARRYYHHATMWGFLFCFASTCVATIYDYFLGEVAPYPLLSLPVVLGTIGGIGLVIGPIGLLFTRSKVAQQALTDQQNPMDFTLIALLVSVSSTGLLLLALRDTQAMAILLAVHLGLVLALFLLLPYSKFIHGFYRLAALLHHADRTNN